MPVRAIWQGKVIAEAAEEDVTIVEGNTYFPPDSVNRELLTESALHSRCYWKGKASYYYIETDGEMNPDAAWYYPKPWPLARKLKNYVAFWRGVRIART